jgi:hypothetical protein
MLDKIWTEEEQRALAVQLAGGVAESGAEMTARRCCYPGVLRFMRNHLPVERQAYLFALFLGNEVGVVDLAWLLAKLNCWLPRRDAPLPEGVREVPLFEAIRMWRGAMPVVWSAEPCTLRGALHLMITAMTRGRRATVRGWAQGAVLDAEHIFKIAADELMADSPGPGVQRAELLLAGWWPVGQDDDGTVFVARIAG